MNPRGTDARGGRVHRRGRSTEQVQRARGCAGCTGCTDAAEFTSAEAYLQARIRPPNYS